MPVQVLALVRAVGPLRVRSFSSGRDTATWVPSRGPSRPMGGGLGGESRIPRHSGRLLEAWQKPRRRAASPHSAAGGERRGGGEPQENFEPRPADQEAGAPRSCREKIAMLGPILLALRRPSDFLRAAPHPPERRTFHVRVGALAAVRQVWDLVHSPTGLGDCALDTSPPTR